MKIEIASEIRLSIIVPVYNMASGGKLEFCLDSLLRQRLPDEEYEIIAVDDCSDDNSMAILQEYAAKYPRRVRVTQTQRNLHQGGAKNVGLTKARGKWIGFCDADDWVSRSCYKKLLDKAEEAGADMAGCDCSRVTKHTFKTGVIEANGSAEQDGVLDDDKYRLLILDGGSLVMKIYKRNIFFGEEGGGPIRFPEGIFYEDNAVSNSLMLRATRYAYVPEPLYYYYQRPDSTVHAATLSHMEDRLEAGRIMLEEAKKRGYYKKYLPEIEYKFTRIFYINTLFSAMQARPAPKGCSAFCRRACAEMKATFPRFQENKYYKERVTAEEQKLIRMQTRQHSIFYSYYRLLWLYRRTFQRNARHA